MPGRRRRWTICAGCLLPLYYYRHAHSLYRFAILIPSAALPGGVQRAVRRGMAAYWRLPRVGNITICRVPSLRVAAAFITARGRL